LQSCSDKIVLGSAISLTGKYSSMVSYSNGYNMAVDKLTAWVVL